MQLSKDYLWTQRAKVKAAFNLWYSDRKCSGADESQSGAGMRHFFHWLKQNIVNVILLAVLFTGAALIAYPTVSNWYNSYHHSVAVMGYAENVASMDPKVVEAAWNSAAAYNEEVAKTGNDWMPDDDKLQKYMKELNLDGSGIMGYIRIQKIDVTLPIYHTTEEKVLQHGVGHLSGTSLPVGGKSSHCILSSHRGLPTARLFTDLDKMVVGDTFQLNILNRTLNYEVDQIRVIEPTDFSDLVITDGEDYCTLFTCTPYGINTHRLLVRGKRTGSKGGAAVPSDAMRYSPALIAPFFAAPILLLGLIWLLLTTSSRSKLRRSRERALSEVMNGTGTVVSASSERNGGNTDKRTGRKTAKKTGKKTRKKTSKK